MSARQKIIAHRGDSSNFVENTLSAFRSAVEKGADALEMDLKRCGSGEIIICHDDNLERLAKLPLIVENTVWDELSQVAINSPGRKDAQDRLCTMDQLLADKVVSCAIKNERQLWLCLELKSNGIEVDVIDIVRDAGILEQTVLYCFCAERLAAALAYEPTIKTNLLFGGDKWENLEIAASLGFWSVNPEKFDVDEKYIEAAHRVGLEVSIGSVNDRHVMATLFELDVWGIHSDVTGVLRKVREVHTMSRT